MPVNWFWKNWFFEKSVPDLAITDVSQKNQKCSVTVSNLGTAIVPVHLTMYFKDGSTKSLDYSISCWENGNKTFKVSFKADKPVTKILLGKPLDADINPNNNVWIAKTN
jgi:hypothetical protein